VWTNNSVDNCLLGCNVVKFGRWYKLFGRTWRLHLQDIRVNSKYGGSKFLPDFGFRMLYRVSLINGIKMIQVVEEAKRDISL
jgi:hypothetical protein